MANVFDQFDSGGNNQANSQGQAQNKPANIFDQFDKPAQTAGNAPQQQSKGFIDNAIDSFMGMTDAFNNEVNKLATGELQLILKGAQYAGIDTTNARAALSNERKVFQAEADKSAKTNPYASLLGNIAGQMTTLGYAAAQGAAAGIPGSSAGLLGTGANATARLGYAGALGTAEKGLEYGTAAERADNAIQGGFGAALGQTIGEGIGLAAKAAINKAGGIRRPIQQAILGEVPQAASNDHIPVSDEFFGTSTPVPTETPANAIPANMTLGQATGNKKLQAYEETMSTVPLLGTKSNVEKANTTLESVVGRNLKALGVGQQETPELAQDFLKGLQQTGTKAKELSDQSFDNAFKMGELEGKRVPLGFTQEAVDNALKDINSLADQEGLKSLNILPQDGKGGTKTGKLLMELQGKEDISPMNFDKLYKAVKSDIKTLKNTNASAADKLISIKDAMNKDLNVMTVTDPGGFGDNLRFSQNLWDTTVKPFKDNSVLKKAIDPMTTPNPDKVLKESLKGDNAFDTNLYLKHNTPAGRQAFTSALIQKAAASSMDAGGKELQLDKLLSNLGKLGDTVGAMPKDTASAIKGLIDVLYNGQHIVRGAKPRVGGPSSAAYSVGGSILAGLTGSAATGSGLGAIASIAAAPALKMINSALTNPRTVRQLIRIANGGLTKATKDATMRSIYKGTILPALGINEE